MLRSILSVIFSPDLHANSKADWDTPEGRDWSFSVWLFLPSPHPQPQALALGEVSLWSRLHWLLQHSLGWNSVLESHLCFLPLCSAQVCNEATSKHALASNTLGHRLGQSPATCFSWSTVQFPCLAPRTAWPLTDILLKSGEPQAGS